MKVVAINGSARKDGNTAIMIRHVFKELEKEDIKTAFRLRPIISLWQSRLSCRRKHNQANMFGKFGAVRQWFGNQKRVR